MLVECLFRAGMVLNMFTVVLQSNSSSFKFCIV